MQRWLIIYAKWGEHTREVTGSNRPLGSTEAPGRETQAYDARVKEERNYT